MRSRLYYLLDFCGHLQIFYEYKAKFIAKVLFLFCLTKYLSPNAIKFIDFYLHIRNIGDLDDKKQAKTGTFFIGELSRVNVIFF